MFQWCLRPPRCDPARPGEHYRALPAVSLARPVELLHPLGSSSSAVTSLCSNFKHQHVGRDPRRKLTFADLDLHLDLHLHLHPAMEDETFTDIDGNRITLQCEDHCSFCREFTVSSPKVSIGKVLVNTCCVWLLAYTVFFFTENTAVLSSAIIITLVGMMLHIHLVKVDHESLLVIGSMGVQVSSSYASGRQRTTFIERSKIKDIVINEAVYMHSIMYYLCILLKETSGPDAVSRVVPLFQSSKPRLNCLVKVYRSCQDVLSKC